MKHSGIAIQSWPMARTPDSGVWHASPGHASSQQPPPPSSEGMASAIHALDPSPCVDLHLSPLQGCEASADNATQAPHNAAAAVHTAPLVHSGQQPLPYSCCRGLPLNR